MGAFDPLVTYEKGTYIETDTGNKVSRKAVITGATNIILGGKSIIQSGAVLRGDLRRYTAGQHVVISMGRYCNISEGVVIRPPGKIYKGSFTFYPVRIGDCVTIGQNSVVEAAQIGLGVEIGKDCIIGKFVIIKDLAVILPETVLPEATVVPPMTVWGGNPGQLLDSLPETHQEMVEAKCKGFYSRFRAA
ncbi:trimeric LpxA-like protein [Kockovaella imperatae]|uniref:Dynactin subunit 5 n=1 Tax=Kockovaella imperatae TaxID=4999 RepID=A0A1Y1UE41_9TREE|nr:trimeric LpxA-like protein [Kockovaella imperatae]ORX35807.1 trimeric LpxA-like protein [Kockovaella imperatae]